MHTSKRQLGGESAYRAAAESALADFERAQEDARQKRKSLAISEARAHELLQLVQKLLVMLPADKAAAYRIRVSRLQSPARAGRGTTTTYDNVVELFAKLPKRLWSPSEVHQELTAKGVPTESEQIHNVFQYLAKKGRLERVSRGRYRVVGYNVGIKGDPLPAAGNGG
jgi:hypothetical protein